MRLWLMLFVMVCAPCVVLPQSSTTYIRDGAGNQVTATVNNGHLYLYDAQGNTAAGSIRNGYIYMNGSDGEYTFGTFKNGNVLLTDQSGNTTGTVRNGHIFLFNGDGSSVTGSYNSSGYVLTTTTPTLEQSGQPGEFQQQQERQQQLNQQSYENGRRIGEGLGNAINGAIAEHRITKYCDNNPTGEYLTGDGVTIQCPQAPLGAYELGKAANYCGNHPGLWIEFGRHRAECNVPPSPPISRGPSGSSNKCSRTFDIGQRQESITPPIRLKRV